MLGYPASIALRRRMASVCQNAAMLLRTMKKHPSQGAIARSSWTNASPITHTYRGFDPGIRRIGENTHRRGGATDRPGEDLFKRSGNLPADEPSSNLDPYKIRLIEHIIGQSPARRRASTILATYDVFQVRRSAGFETFIVAGTLVRIGPIDAIFERPAEPSTRVYRRGILLE
jgi:hypothetical protein